MKPGVISIMLFVLVLSVIGGWIIAGDGGATGRVEVLTARAELRSFEVTLATVGEMEAARATNVASPIRGDRGKIVHLIDDGAAVDAEDVLVVLDPTPFEEEVRRLEDVVLEAEGQVDAHAKAIEFEETQLERELRVARFDIRTAELELTKLERGDGPLELARLEGALETARQGYEQTAGYVDDLQLLQERGYISDAEILQAQKKAEEAHRSYDIARRQYETYRDYVFPSLVERAEGRLEQARHDLHHLQKSGGLKIGRAMAAHRNAEQNLSLARRNLDMARAELEATIIRAPIPGMVVLREEHRGGQRRKPRIGDSVWHNQPILYLPDVSQMIVNTRVREIDLHYVDVGYPVIVQVDAYPSLRFSGEVTALGVLAQSEAGQQRGERFFSVTVRVDDSDHRLRPGMTSRLTILCGEAESVVTVPVNAIFLRGEETYCYVDTGEGFSRRPVVLGMQNHLVAEVVEGIEQDEVVALHRPPDELVVGESVERDHTATIAANTSFAKR